MADGNYEFLVTGRNSTNAVIDAFQDGTNTEGDPIIRLIARQEAAFTALVNDIKTAIEGTLDVAIVGSSIPFDSNIIEVDTNSTTIIDINCAGKNTLGCVISNIGATDFNDFQVSVRYQSEQPFYIPITFTNADFDTNVGRQSGNSLIPVQASSGIGNPSESPNPRLLAGASDGWLELRVSAYESIRLTASVASGTTTARIRGIVQ